MVLDAVEDLELHWAAELADVEFAVEDVPPHLPASADVGPDLVLDRGVTLGRLYRDRTAEVEGPLIVVYRRPVEARAADGEDRGDLVFMVVAELAAEYLGRDIEEVDPS